MGPRRGGAQGPRGGGARGPRGGGARGPRGGGARGPRGGVRGDHEEEGRGAPRRRGVGPRGGGWGQKKVQPPRPAQSTLWPRMKEGLTVIQAPMFRDCAM